MYVESKILRGIYRKRDPWSHKGQYGKLVVIAGSKRHTGSACFVGMAACRAGCDLIYIASPQRSADMAANFSPSLITEPLSGDKLKAKHVPKILSLIKEVRGTAVAIGPGLWRDNDTKGAILKLIKKIELPMVVDADAVRAVASRKDILKGKKCVLTPHADEFRQLSGKAVGNSVKERSQAVLGEAKMIRSVIVLKGSTDIISDGRSVILSRTGTSLMTKGGFGDTMAGICGAYLSMGIDTVTAACAAAYVNGRAGQIAAKKLGVSILPTDLIDEIPNAIKIS